MRVFTYYSTRLIIFCSGQRKIFVENVIIPAFYATACRKKYRGKASGSQLNKYACKRPAAGFYIPSLRHTEFPRLHFWLLTTCRNAYSYPQNAATAAFKTRQKKNGSKNPFFTLIEFKRGKFFRSRRNTETARRQYRLRSSSLSE